MVQPQDRLRDFVRRAEQEPIAQQLVELDAEIVVARGHRLVLTPLLIGRVFRPEVGRAHPDRLLA